MTINKKKLAKSACIALGDDPKREGPWRLWWHESPYANMVDAILNDIAKQGFVIAPKEPTKEMVTVGKEVGLWRDDELTFARSIYKAMLSASPSIPEKEA